MAADAVPCDPVVAALACIPSHHATAASGAVAVQKEQTATGGGGWWGLRTDGRGGGFGLAARLT